MSNLLNTVFVVLALVCALANLALFVRHHLPRVRLTQGRCKVERPLILPSMIGTIQADMTLAEYEQASDVLRARCWDRIERGEFLPFSYNVEDKR